MLLPYRQTLLHLGLYRSRSRFRVSCLRRAPLRPQYYLHPQLLKTFNQPGIVALVETNTGFVEYVPHSHKLGADLRSQTYALRFPAGKRI